MTKARYIKSPESANETGDFFITKYTMDKQFDTPNPTTKVVFGFQHILKPMPKIAARIGLALTAMSACGLGYTMLSDTHPEWSKWMAVLGILGAGITTLFGKK